MFLLIYKIYIKSQRYVGKIQDLKIKSRPFGRQFWIYSNFGAEPAHNFELLSSIADWLFSNKIADAFRLPQLDTKSIRLQGLQPSYTY